MTKRLFDAAEKKEEEIIITSTKSVKELDDEREAVRIERRLEAQNRSRVFWRQTVQQLSILAVQLDDPKINPARELTFE